MDPAQGTAGWATLPPGAPQSLSPFESRATTLAVLWATLIISSMVLTLSWIFWV